MEDEIRRYVLHPYQAVQDMRTGVVSADAQGVLDGDLEAFLRAAMARKRQKRDPYAATMD